MVKMLIFMNYFGLYETIDVFFLTFNSPICYFWYIKDLIMGKFLFFVYIYKYFAFVYEC